MIDPATHWRDSGRRPMVGPLDAQIIYPFLLFFFNASFKTFMFFLASIIFFGILAKYKMTIKIVVRLLKSFLAGPVRTRKGWWQ